MTMVKRAINILLVVAIVLVAWVVWNHPDWIVAGPPRQHNSIICPPGSYDIGDVCKAEPTGCPNGDAIPVDSPKCQTICPETDPMSPYEDNCTPPAYGPLIDLPEPGFIKCAERPDCVKKLQPIESQELQTFIGK